MLPNQHPATRDEKNGKARRRQGSRAGLQGMKGGDSK